MVGIWKLASLSRRYATWREVEPSTFRTPLRAITSSWNWVIRSKPSRNEEGRKSFDDVLEDEGAFSDDSVKKTLKHVLKWGVRKGKMS